MKGWWQVACAVSALTFTALYLNTAGGEEIQDSQTGKKPVTAEQANGKKQSPSKNLGTAAGIEHTSVPLAEMGCLVAHKRVPGIEGNVLLLFRREWTPAEKAEADKRRQQGLRTETESGGFGR